MRKILFTAIAAAGFTLASSALSQPLTNLKQITRQATEHVKAGRLDEAEKIYDFLLSLAPNHPAFMLEMAHIQMLQKDWKGAKVKLERVRDRGAVPTNIARNIDYRLAYIEEKTYRHRLRSQISFGLTGQSNVNAGPEDRQVDIYGLPFTLSDSALPQSDILARTAIDLDYRYRLGDGDRFLNAQLTYVGSNYAEFDALNRQDLGARIGLLLPLENFPLPSSHLQIYASGNKTWIGGDPYMDTTAVVVSFSAAPIEKVQVKLSASYQHDDYVESNKRPIADMRDSDKATLSFTTFYAPGHGWKLMGGFDYAALDARSDSNSWSGMTLRAGLSKTYSSPLAALPGAWTSAVSAEYTQRDYDAPELAFGSAPQSSDINRISFVQTVPLSAATEAKLSLTSTKAESNYSIYSWSDRTASLSFVYKF